MTIMVVLLISMVLKVYILSRVRVSIHMYEAKRAVAGCCCSGKEEEGRGNHHSCAIYNRN